jgi:potassium efflux system protein
MPVPRVVVACVVAILATTSFAQQPDAVRGIAAENFGLLARISDETTTLDSELIELANVRKAKSDLDERMHRIERRASVYALGQEFAQTLIEQLRQLPRLERLAAAHQQRAESLAAASDANLRVERALDELDDLDAAATKRLATAQTPVSEEQRLQAAPAVRAALAEQRGLLERLAALQKKRFEALREAGEVERELERQSEAARAELTRFLFWIPAPPSTKTIGALVPALAWTVSPTNWGAAGAVMWEELTRRPFWPVLALFAAACLLALRGRLRHALVSLSPAVVTYERYRIGHALAAIAITLALALPGPIGLWTAATLVATAPDSQPFALALGGALMTISRLLLAISTLAWLLDRNGVAIRHFGWDEVSLSGTARALRSFAAIFVPLAFVAALNGLDHAPFANRESLARLAFGLTMVALIVFLARLFKRSAPLMQRLRAQAPRSWAVQLHAVWFLVLLAVPLAIAALSGGGYFFAAAYFFGRIVDSVFLGIGAAMLYGLMALWVQVQRLHLARRRNAEIARPADAGLAREAGSEVAQARPAQLDIAMIGEQTRSLLDLFVTVLLLGGIWWVWREAVPMLSVISDYALWSYSDLVDGKQVAHPLTVGHLLLAIVVGVVTAVLVRNVGALLDIVLLQRFEMQTDATYAIKVIARYAVTIVGVLLACNILGIRWGDVQWLVAALGVGLGFGLQEIVANFVSGLIVLTERPIRIGDVVTVGGVSGTVARIHARATVVIDFDNKEVIIPNKAFITERVINWTLSNQTTRLLSKIGVAYGSDIALVQRAMLDAVRGNRDVLQDPAPSVFFVAFGDSTLDFEIRAFVDSLDKRLRVQHEINIEVARVLRENGIEIPFPQRDLHIRSAPGLVGSMRNEQPPGSQS